MANIDLDISILVKDGLELTSNLTTVSPSNDYYFVNTGKEIVYVKNTTGNTCFVEIERVGTVDGAAPAARIATALNATENLIGVFEPSWFNDELGRVHLSFDQAVGVAIVRTQPVAL